MTIVEAYETAPATHRRRGARRMFVDLVNYGLASAAALACDYALLVLLNRAGLDYRAAAFVGFMGGMGVAYGLSALFVFPDRRATSRFWELVGFVAVGLGGLLLTEILLYVLVSHIGISPALAKMPTAGAVFMFNFLCRRAFVFSRE